MCIRDRAGGADGDLEDVHGGQDGGGGGEALEEALAAPGMDAGILDEADAQGIVTTENSLQNLCIEFSVK